MQSLLSLLTIIPLRFEGSHGACELCHLCQRRGWAGRERELPKSPDLETCDLELPGDCVEQSKEDCRRALECLSRFVSSRLGDAVICGIIERPEVQFALVSIMRERTQAGAEEGAGNEAYAACYLFNQCAFSSEWCALCMVYMGGKRERMQCVCSGEDVERKACFAACPCVPRAHACDCVRTGRGAEFCVSLGRSFQVKILPLRNT